MGEDRDSRSRSSSSSSSSLAAQSHSSLQLAKLTWSLFSYSAMTYTNSCLAFQSNTSRRSASRLKSRYARSALGPRVRSTLLWTSDWSGQEVGWVEVQVWRGEQGRGTETARAGRSGQGTDNLVILWFVICTEVTGWWNMDVKEQPQLSANNACVRESGCDGVTDGCGG